MVSTRFSIKSLFLSAIFSTSIIIHRLLLLLFFFLLLLLSNHQSRKSPPAIFFLQASPLLSAGLYPLPSSPITTNSGVNGCTQCVKDLLETYAVCASDSYIAVKFSLEPFATAAVGLVVVNSLVSCDLYDTGSAATSVAVCSEGTESGYEEVGPVWFYSASTMRSIAPSVDVNGGGIPNVAIHKPSKTAYVSSANFYNIAVFKISGIDTSAPALAGTVSPFGPGDQRAHGILVVDDNVYASCLNNPPRLVKISVLNFSYVATNKYPVGTSNINHNLAHDDNFIYELSGNAYIVRSTYKTNFSVVSFIKLGFSYGTSLSISPNLKALFVSSFENNLIQMVNVGSFHAAGSPITIAKVKGKPLTTSQGLVYAFTRFASQVYPFSYVDATGSTSTSDSESTSVSDSSSRSVSNLSSLTHQLSESATSNRSASRTFGESSSHPQSETVALSSTTTQPKSLSHDRSQSFTHYSPEQRGATNSSPPSLSVSFSVSTSTNTRRDSLSVSITSVPIYPNATETSLVSTSPSVPVSSIASRTPNEENNTENSLSLSGASRSILASKSKTKPIFPEKTTPALVAFANVANSITLVAAAASAAVFPAAGFGLARQQAKVNFLVNIQDGANDCSGMSEIEAAAVDSPTQMQIGSSDARYFVGGAVGNVILTLSLLGSVQIGGYIYTRKVSQSKWKRSPFVIFARCHGSMVLLIIVSMLFAPSIKFGLVAVALKSDVVTSRLTVGEKMIAFVFGVMIYGGMTTYYTIRFLFLRTRKERYRKLSSTEIADNAKNHILIRRIYDYLFEGPGEWELPKKERRKYGNSKEVIATVLNFEAAYPLFEGYQKVGWHFAAFEFLLQVSLAFGEFLAQVVPKESSCLAQGVTIIAATTFHFVFSVWLRPFQERFNLVVIPVMDVLQIVTLALGVYYMGQGELPDSVNKLAEISVAIQTVVTVLMFAASLDPLIKAASGALETEEEPESDLQRMTKESRIEEVREEEEQNELHEESNQETEIILIQPSDRRTKNRKIAAVEQRLNERSRIRKEMFQFI